ncbi:unnamed protein product [Amoebophrya sp. A25]|nr:unnamed protein product [Amoebophrya sp. A25]|eukprot:GSA25T00009381001.1
MNGAGGDKGKAKKQETDEEDEMQFIDFEYCLWSSRGYDLCNQFAAIPE